MKRGILATGLGMALGLSTAHALAQEGPWLGQGPYGSPRPQAPERASGPSVSLGRPIPLDAGPSTGAQPARLDPAIQRSSYRAAELAPPSAVIQVQAPDPANPSFIPPPPRPVGAPFPGIGDERYNSGIIVDNPVPGPPPGGKKWFDWVPGMNGGSVGSNGGRCLFESDHCFDQFISPVTNPFLFEDPRSLTEVRPIFMWQQTPSHNYVYKGGDIVFSGLQGRVAFTDRWSLVINKLGWIWSEPHAGYAAPSGDFGAHGGFAEIMLGPKFTFIRNDNCGTLLAGGLTFDIPTGSSKVFQDTGDLSLIPYLSYAQNFGRTSFGSFNFMSTFGYSFRVDNARTEYFYSSYHLDYGLARKFYPFIELNWFSYTRSGTVRPLGFEGADLINFGSQGVSGNNFVSLAPGLRYKFNEMIQTGLAAEFPITGRRDLMDFRLTVDLIIRY